MATDAFTGSANISSLSNAILGNPDGLTQQQCPRCRAPVALRLDKADPQAHTCYRCKSCGHIFSPRVAN